LMQENDQQRRESIETYRKAGRDDLADQEVEEIAVIDILSAAAAEMTARMRWRPWAPWWPS